MMNFKSYRLNHRRTRISTLYRMCRKFVPKPMRSWLETYVIYKVNTASPMVYVSLGENCLPATVLKQIQLRRFSGPFDWLLGRSFHIVMGQILNDFKESLIFEDLIYTGDRSQDPGKTIVINRKFDITYFHDFKNQSFEEYQAVLTKYQRRQTRFFELTKNSDVVFIYSRLIAGQDYSGITEGLIANYFKRLSQLKNKLGSKSITLLLVVRSDKQPEDISFCQCYEGGLRLLIQPIPNSYIDDKFDPYLWQGDPIKKILSLISNGN